MLVSQFLPEYPALQVQVYVFPVPFVQVAPFRHGLSAQVLAASEQVAPE
jgi:hypothetical protein